MKKVILTNTEKKEDGIYEMTFRLNPLWSKWLIVRLKFLNWLIKVLLKDVLQNKK